MLPASFVPIREAVSTWMPTVAAKTAISAPKVPRRDRILIHSECRTGTVGRAVLMGKPPWEERVRGWR